MKASFYLKKKTHSNEDKHAGSQKIKKIKNKNYCNMLYLCVYYHKKDKLGFAKKLCSHRGTKNGFKKLKKKKQCKNGPALAVLHYINSIRNVMLKTFIEKIIIINRTLCILSFSNIILSTHNKF